MTGEFIEMKPLNPEETDDWEPHYEETEIDPFDRGRLTAEEEFRLDQLLEGAHDETPLTAEEDFRLDQLLGRRTEVDGPIMTMSDRRAEAIRRRLVYRDCGDFFSNILDLEPQCSQPEFVDWLTDRGVLGIKRVFSEYDMTADYEVRYLGGDFTTDGRTMDGERFKPIRNGIRLYYDEWARARLKRTMKKAGVVAAVGLGVIALVTGLSVGLTRKGADMVHQAKKWGKLQPSKRVTTIPWTDIEKAGGKTVMFAGEYYLVVIGAVYLLVRKRRA